MNTDCLYLLTEYMDLPESMNLLMSCNDLYTPIWLLNEKGIFEIYNINDFCKYGCLYAVEYLYKKPNMMDMISALNAGKTEVVKYLHENGGDINYMMNYAASSRSLELLKYLKSINKNGSIDIMGIAVQSGSLECVKYLYSIGFPHVGVNDAAFLGHLDIVEYLYEYIDCSQAINKAVESKKWDVVKFLLDSGEEIIYESSYEPTRYFGRADRHIKQRNIHIPLMYWFKK